MNAKHALLSITLATVLGLAACNPSTETTTSNPLGGSIPDSVIVPPADAERMIANYAPRAGYVIRDGDTLPGTRGITFGLTLLENYLTELRLQDVLGPIYPMASSSNSRSSLPIEITASNRYLPGG